MAIRKSQTTQSKAWNLRLVPWERKDCDSKLLDWLEVQLQLQNQKPPLHGLNTFWSSFIACVTWWDPYDEISVFSNPLLLHNPFLDCFFLFSRRSVLLLTWKPCSLWPAAFLISRILEMEWCFLLRIWAATVPSLCHSTSVNHSLFWVGWVD